MAAAAEEVLVDAGAVSLSPVFRIPIMPVTKGVVSDDDPTIARFRHHLGHLLLRTGRLAEARAELERSQREFKFKKQVQVQYGV